MSPFKTEQTPCVIVGAGISGLMAATQLREQRIDTILLDKGRGIGGRLATRRMDGGATLDHGAQFFTARAESFLAQVQQWAEKGVIHPWAPDPRTPPGKRWRGTDGMTTLAKHLGQSLEVRLGHRVEHMRLLHSGKGEARWQIETDQRLRVEAEALLLTAPVPQSLALIQQMTVFPEHLDPSRLPQVDYHSCLALLMTLDTPTDIPSPGYLSLEHPTIGWVADNQQKGISETPAVTLHTTPSFSKRYFEAEDSAIFDDLYPEVQSWLPGTVIEYQVKRWRYSEPQQVYPEPCFVASTLPLLVMAGDGFCSPRVEGAALSGMAAATVIQQQLNIPAASPSPD